MPSKGLNLIAKQTFSRVLSVSFDNCFSSAYTHYYIRSSMSVKDSASNFVNIRLRSSGTDASGSNYAYQYTVGTGSGFQTNRGTSTSFLSALGRIETSQSGYREVWISHPFESIRTTCFTDNSEDIDGNILCIAWMQSHDLSNSYTGFSAISALDTMTGSISVFGLAKS